jgi:hypothetical protein
VGKNYLGKVKQSKVQLGGFGLGATDNSNTIEKLNQF